LVEKAAPKKRPFLHDITVALQVFLSA